MNDNREVGLRRGRKEGRRYIRIKVAVSPAEDLEVCIDRVRRIRRGLRENSRASFADLGFFRGGDFGNRSERSERALWDLAQNDIEIT